MPRRPTGTIAPKPDGNFRARITLVGGDRPWIDVPAGADEDAAREFAQLAAKRVRDGSAVFVGKAKVSDESVSDWCDRWLDDKEQKGQTSVPAVRSHLDTHIYPAIGDHPMSAVSKRDLESIVQTLDTKIRTGAMRWKTALNIWGTITKMFDEAERSKTLSLRIRDDNPARGVRGPDRGVHTTKVHLHPDEFLKLVRCDAIPIQRRRYYAIAIYNYLRPAELEALRWEDVDLESETIHIRRGIDRLRGVEKSPKSGAARAPFAMEPAILPLLRVMHAERMGEGPVVGDLGDERTLAERLRADLLTAGVRRAELHTCSSSPPRQWMRMHDCRTTGITWMAVRGDEPMVVMARAGHSDFKTTLGYINGAALVRRSYGTVFPELPQRLIESSNESSTPHGKRAQLPDGKGLIGGSAWESNPPAAP